MTEYWKSQARKYCEFCKCWFSDNKVSVSFHENGKKHKENVQKHISQLSKKSAKDHKRKEKMDDDIKKMEEAAMAAYLKDVQNNADLTSQSINQMLGQNNNTNNTGNISVIKSSTKIPPLWQEVKGEDGSSYFWNTETNETTWDAPDEYLSIAQQEKKKLEEKESKKVEQKLKKEKRKEACMEAKAYVAREQMRELAVSKFEAPTFKSDMNIGPAPRADPYGAWTSVINEPKEKLNLQLPKPDKLPLAPPVVVEPEIIQFKEKRVQSLGDEFVEFKKRKLNNNKRNIRQKLEDE